VRLESKSSLGRDRVVKKVELQHPARVLLSSDKPLYQPGQTIHLCSLSLNGRSQKPLAGEAVTFAVKDPKGNQVFQETRPSSKFGIASVDFVLASDLNLGRYEVSATAGAAATERTVEVKRYVLPKFKIHLAAGQPYYLPGQTVSGSVQANYFFGRSVSGATVRLTATTSQEQPVVIQGLQGRTDGDGKYSFQFALPDFLAGLSQPHEPACLDLKAELRDPAQQVAETTLSLSVARSALELTAVPEAGALRRSPTSLRHRPAPRFHRSRLVPGGRSRGSFSAPGISRLRRLLPPPAGRVPSRGVPICRPRAPTRRSELS